MSSTSDLFVIFEELVKIEKDNLKLMLKLFNYDIEFYLPQIFQMFIRSHFNENIRSFLLQKSLFSFHFAVKLSWLIDAELCDNEVRYPKLNKFRIDLEDSIISAQRAVNEYNKINEMEDRLNHYYREIMFFQFLSNLSLRMKDYPKEVRNQRLRIELDRFVLPSTVYFPLDWEMNRVCRIVSIVSSECFCFSTKERV